MTFYFVLYIGLFYFFFFVRTGKWGEVKSQCAEPEGGKTKALGDTGKEGTKNRVVPRAPPIFFYFSCFFIFPPPLKVSHFDLDVYNDELTIVVPCVPKSYYKG